MKNIWYSFRWRLVLCWLLAGICFWYFVVYRYEPPSIGSGPAGPEIPLSPFADIWDTSETVLLGVGDSITSGFGASNERSCYFMLLAKNLDSIYPDMKGKDLASVISNLEYYNIASPCTTSYDHILHTTSLKKFKNNIKGIVCLTSGGNDLIHNYGRSAPQELAMYGCTEQQARSWQPAYRLRLITVIDKIISVFPAGCSIFIGTIYDPTDGVGDIQNASLMLPEWSDGVKALAIWNNTIKEVASQYSNVHVVDIHQTFLGHGIHCTDKNNPYYHPNDPNYWYYINLEDPNDRGYDALRRIFLQKICEVYTR